MTEPLAIGVDVGGTKVAAGVVRAQGAIEQRIVAPTPVSDSVGIEDVIVKAVNELAEGRQVAGVGIGAAGYIDANHGVVRFSPNTLWREEPLRDRVMERVGLPVVVENDANAAAWGEYRFGAGRSARVMVMVTVGTGIGGGVVLNGSLFHGATGAAPEVGHIRMVRDGLPCACGRRGCWEQYASGNALGRVARELAGADPAAAAELIHLAGGIVDNIDGREVTRAAHAGDAVALAAFAEVGQALGIGLADLAALFEPDVIVVGGGAADAGSLLMDPARSVFAAERAAGGFSDNTSILDAQLGNEAGLVGAADLARVTT